MSLIRNRQTITVDTANDIVSVVGDITATGSITTDTMVIDKLNIKTNTGTDTENFSIALGNDNTMAGVNDTTALHNILIGNSAGKVLFGGDRNILIGTDSGEALNSGSDNVAVGHQTLTLITGDVGNVAVGSEALKIATTFANTALGFEAGIAIDSVSGGSNTVVGYQVAPTYNGIRSTMVGKDAGIGVTTGDDVVFIGEGATGGDTFNNQISIGRDATCDAVNQCTIGNAFIDSIRPGSDKTCNLGEFTSQFKDLYVDGDSHIKTIIALPITSIIPGALSLASTNHQIETSGTGDAFTLANGSLGQIMNIVYVLEQGGTDTAILTPTTLFGGTTITFNALADSCSLVYTDNGWGVLSLNGTAALA